MAGVQKSIGSEEFLALNVEVFPSSGSGNSLVPFKIGVQFTRL